jgi:hypothetical protein
MKVNIQYILYPHLIHWLILYWYTCHLVHLPHIKIGDISICRLRATEFKLMLGAQGLWAGGSLSCHICFDTGPWLFFSVSSGSIPYSHLLRHERSCWGPTLTRILKGFKDTWSSLINAKRWINHYWSSNSQRPEYKKYALPLSNMSYNR